MPLCNAQLKAYRETHYHVYAEPSFYMVPDVYSEDLTQLQQKAEVTSSAFITAWNPYSKITSDSINARNHKHLCRKATEPGLLYVNGLGKHPTNDWPGEQSLLILGIDRLAAIKLGKAFHQNAILVADESAVPELIVLVPN